MMAIIPKLKCLKNENWVFLCLLLLGGLATSLLYTLSVALRFLQLGYKYVCTCVISYLLSVLLPIFIQTHHL